MNVFDNLMSATETKMTNDFPEGTLFAMVPGKEYPVLGRGTRFDDDILVKKPDEDPEQLTIRLNKGLMDTLQSEGVAACRLTFTANGTPKYFPLYRKS